MSQCTELPRLLRRYITAVLKLFPTCGCCHRHLYKPKHVNCRLYWRLEPCWLTWSPACGENLVPVLYSYLSRPWISHPSTWVVCCLEGDNPSSVVAMFFKFGLLEGGRPAGRSAVGSLPQDTLTGPATSWTLLLFYSRACIFGLCGLTHDQPSRCICGLFCLL
jgi:hypothetical protein